MTNVQTEPPTTNRARETSASAVDSAVWKRKLKVRVLSVLLLGAIIGIWALITRAGLVDEVILPRPSEVASALVSLLGESFFYANLWVTTQEVLAGFAIGTVLGSACGALLGISRIAREITYPYVVAFAGLPKVVLAPVIITAAGFGTTSKVVMAIVICFFPMLVNTELGLTSVDPEATRLMRSLNASRRDILVKLSLPHSLPLIFAGMKTALALALVGAIVGEFVGASSGLGYLLSQYSYQLDIPRVWAITFILAAMGVVLFVAIEQLDRKIVFWARSSGSVEV